MNPSETRADAAPVCSVLSDSADSNRLWTFIGNYYRVLGWVDLVSSVIALGLACWTGRVAICCGFVFWFSLGNGLKRGSSSARKWAIISPIAMMLVLVLGLMFPEMGLRLAPWGIGQTHPAFLPFAGIDLVVFAVPVVLLLGGNARRALTNA